MNVINKKVLYIFLICFCLIITNTYVFPIDAENIIAYPVPFNPKIHSNLRIGNKPGTTIGTVDKLKVEIYDINGDTVFTREYSSMINILWNGRNKNDKIVKPGLYIIKVTVENSATGEYGKKMIRILING